MKRLIIAIVIVCLTIVFFNSCKKKVPLNVRYWKSADTGFKFPELNDQELKYTPILNRPNCGICISGGGTVSAALSAGYFKALTDLGLVNNLRYISGVSGGSWGSAPYCFLPADISDDHFLGPKYPPEKLTKKVLKEVKERSMAYAVTHARIGDLSQKNIIHGHSAFTRAVGEIFLEPFGIDHTGKYFSTDKDTVAKIIERNPESGLNFDDFVTLRQNRPYLIINGTIFIKVPHYETCSKYTIYPFEFTPLYSGLKAVQRLRENSYQTIGGIFMESFGFNNLKSVAAGKGRVSVIPGKKRFSLCEPVGTSGDAVENLFINSWASKLITIPLPNYKYWNPLDPKFPDIQKYNFGDGGFIEDTGVAALLSRDVKNIVVFLTSPFDPETPIDRYDPSEMINRYFGYNQVACLFGQEIYNIGCGPNYGSKISDPYKRQVFCPDQFENLKKKFQDSKKNGGPPFVSGSYEVVDNEMFGIKGGWRCNIIWMCVDTSETFNGKLPPEVSKEIGQPGELKDFPAVKVFYENKDLIIQLTPIQANLLGNFAYWMVREKKHDIKILLEGKANFPDFKKLIQ